MTHFIYFIALAIFLCGMFMMLTSDSYIRKIIGLSIFQSSVLIFYIALGKVAGGVIPIERCVNSLSNCQEFTYSNPLPHVLMLTAIVVSFSTLSFGLALIYRIYKQFGTIFESKINLSDVDDS